MRVVDLRTWPRRDHFAKFGAFRYPHFSMCAPVDVTAFGPAVRHAGASLTAAVVYLISKVANEIPEFRYRIRGDAVIEHDTVHPSITVLLAESLFGFAQFDYCEPFTAFAPQVAARMAQARQEPTLSDAPGRDDLLFMSAIPWVSFTSFSHPMPTLPADSIPRFAWGKIYEEGSRRRMPLGVQGHHGLMDGWHVGCFYERAQALLDDPAGLLSL